MSKTTTQWVTIREFAKRFGYEPRYVLTLVQSGKIPAMRLKYSDGRGGDWRIDLEALEVESNGCETSYQSMDSSRNNVSSNAARFKSSSSIRPQRTPIKQLIQRIDEM